MRRPRSFEPRSRRATGSGPGSAPAAAVVVGSRRCAMDMVDFLPRSKVQEAEGMRRQKKVAGVSNYGHVVVTDVGGAAAGQGPRRIARFLESPRLAILDLALGRRAMTALKDKMSDG